MILHFSLSQHAQVLIDHTLDAQLIMIEWLLRTPYHLTIGHYQRNCGTSYSLLPCFVVVERDWNHDKSLTNKIQDDPKLKSAQKRHCEKKTRNRQFISVCVCVCMCVVVFVCVRGSL